jgi:hypothetical protein
MRKDWCTVIYMVYVTISRTHTSGIPNGIYIWQSNIFVCANGHPRLADFGLTIISDFTLSLTMTNNEAFGALRWLAPELIRTDDDEATTRKTSEADVFSFGRVCLAVCMYSWRLVSGTDGYVGRRFAHGAIHSIRRLI